MTKIRIIIYSTLLLIIFLGLSISIIKLLSQNKPIDNETIEITPPPIIEINWDEAVNLIQDCKIKIVFQKRNLEVTLTHKDNRIFKTKEPKYNDVFEETNHLRSDCNDFIQTITE